MRRPAIVVVDDDRDLLAMMESLLTEEDYRALPCDDAGRAHGLVEREQPRLVILDIRLPDPATGLGLLERLRADPATRGIPVLVYSADTGFFRRHADDLRRLDAATLEKPFDLDELLAQIARLIAPGVAAPEHLAPLPSGRRPWPSR